MKKVYHLSSCNSCQRIMKEVGVKDFEQQDIKTEAITPDQLDEMVKLTDSYEALFSRRARKYREMGLKEKNLTEDDYRELILEHYTFLKRPVFLAEGKIYVGNSKKVVAQLKEDLGREA